MSSAKVLAEEGEVGHIYATVDSGGCRFFCYTSCIRESWIIHVSNGIDVWRSVLDQAKLDSHRELADVNSCEAYFLQFKKAFTLGDLLVTKQAHKICLDVGTGATSLKYDLYEATASERKSDLQSALFWLADTTAEATKKIGKCEEELNAMKKSRGGTGGGALLPDIDNKKRPGQVKLQKQQGHSIVNPSSKRRKAAQGVQFD